MKISKKMADMKAQFPELWQFAEEEAKKDYRSFCDGSYDESMEEWRQLFSYDESMEEWRQMLPENEGWIAGYVMQFMIPTFVEPFREKAGLTDEELIAAYNQEDFEVLEALRALSIAYGTKLIDLLKSYYGTK